MSRIESGRLTLRNEEFSFARLLETVNTIFAGQCRDKGQTYRCHIVNEVDDYYIGDNMKLRQALINIEDMQRSLQSGMNAHLSKPVKPDALYETLEGLIRP